MTKNTKEQTTRSMYKLYLLTFFAGAGLFFFNIISHAITLKPITNEYMNNTLLGMFGLWSLGAVVTGLDYFGRKSKEDRLNDTSQKESTK